MHAGLKDRRTAFIALRVSSSTRKCVEPALYRTAILKRAIEQAIFYQSILDKPERGTYVRHLWIGADRLHDWHLGFDVWGTVGEDQRDATGLLLSCPNLLSLMFDTACVSRQSGIAMPFHLIEYSCTTALFLYDLQDPCFQSLERIHLVIAQDISNNTASLLALNGLLNIQRLDIHWPR
jgi:hypothetical protein